MQSEAINSIPEIDTRSWGLSETTTTFLARSLELTSAIAEARKLLPFPADYKPKVFEVLFDDVPFIRIENGKIAYLRDCSSDYKPPCSEFAFDGETALFQVRGEVVVNRVERMDLSAINQLLEVNHGS